MSPRPGPDPGFAVYEALVGMARPTRLALEQAGFAPEVIQAELGRLAGAGMILLGHGGSIEVMAPEVALPRYAEHLERVAAHSRQVVDELGDQFRRARAERDLAAGIEAQILTDIPELERVRVQLFHEARDTVLLVAARNPLNDALLMDPPGPPGPGARGPVWTCAFDSSVLDIEGSHEALDQWRAAGAEVRLAPGLAVSLLVIDRSAVLADISHHDPTGLGSLLIRHPPWVRALTTVAEATLAAAALPPVVSAAARARHGAREAQVLALLAAGASDATIARQLGVSQRTVERYIRRILDNLDAITRFQAGVQAQRRGLLTGGPDSGLSASGPPGSN